MKEEIKVLLRRAKIFEEDARNDFENKNFDIAMFHLEQAAQLLIKAKLLDLKGSFTKTHSLRLLLSELSRSWKRKEIKKFIKKYLKVLRDLERAYISSRYIYEEFFEDEVRNAFKLIKELRKLLWQK